MDSFKESQMQPVKWAGGKSSLLGDIIRCLPPNINHPETRYVEPFLGSGSVVLGLIEAGYLKPQQTILVNDSNTALINLFRWIRQDVETLIGIIAQSLATYEALWKADPSGEQARSCYDAVRREYNQATDKTTVVYAATFYFLNQTCFNGLYRVNQKGDFNVPMGKRGKGSTYQLSELKAASLRRLSTVLNTYRIEFFNLDYATFLQQVQPTPADVVYWDPPYFPVTATSFTAYQGEFNLEAFSQVWQHWSTRTRCIHSNADTVLTRELFAGLRIVELIARRSVGAKTRAAAKELLVMTF